MYFKINQQIILVEFFYCVMQKGDDKSYKSTDHHETEPDILLNLQVCFGQVVQSTDAGRVDDHNVESGLVDDHSLLDLASALLHHIVGFILSDI